MPPAKNPPSAPSSAPSSPEFAENTQNLIRAIVFSSCLGALKDWQSGGPIDEKSFAHNAPRFLDQAFTLYGMLMTRLASYQLPALPEEPPTEAQAQ